MTCYDDSGITKSGAPVGLGSLAVDPSVIAIGSHVYVPGYGMAVADDTGSAIVGDRLDVWLPTTRACAAWGHHWVDVEAAA